MFFREYPVGSVMFCLFQRILITEQRSSSSGRLLRSEACRLKLNFISQHLRRAQTLQHDWPQIFGRAEEKMKILPIIYYVRERQNLKDKGWGVMLWGARRGCVCVGRGAGTCCPVSCCYLLQGRKCLKAMPQKKCPRALPPLKRHRSRNTDSGSAGQMNSVDATITLYKVMASLVNQISGFYTRHCRSRHFDGLSSILCVSQPCMLFYVFVSLFLIWDFGALGTSS